MAEKIMKYYEYIKSQKGIAGGIELATYTKIPSTKAAMIQDSAENIKLFKDAIEKITGKPAPFY